MAHAGIQQSWLGRVDELVTLGLPVRSLTDLAAQVEAMTEDDVLLPRMPADVRQWWLASVPVLAESCRRLDEIGPGPTLVHGDFHPWNVASGPATTRVFDWTDAAVSHPFVDLATYVFRTEDAAVRRRLVDAYVGAWAGVASEESLREAAALGSGGRGAVPGADLPGAPAGADGERCGRRTGGCRPLLDQAQPGPARAWSREPRPDLRRVASRRIRSRTAAAVPVARRQDVHIGWRAPHGSSDSGAHQVARSAPPRWVKDAVRSLSMEQNCPLSLWTSTTSGKSSAAVVFNRQCPVSHRKLQERGQRHAHLTWVHHCPVARDHTSLFEASYPLRDRR